MSCLSTAEMCFDSQILNLHPPQYPMCTPAQTGFEIKLETHSPLPASESIFWADNLYFLFSYSTSQDVISIPALSDYFISSSWAHSFIQQIFTKCLLPSTHTCYVLGIQVWPKQTQFKSTKDNRMASYDDINKRRTSTCVMTHEGRERKKVKN